MAIEGVRRRAGWPQGLTLLAASMLPAMGVVLVAPNLPALNARFADAPGGAYMVSVALTMPGLCIALLSPFAGFVVDRQGRCKALSVSLILYALFGMAPLGLNTLPALIASRAGVGIVEAVIITSVFALIGDYFHEEDRHRWLAYHGSFTALAATLLYMIGGALGNFGWRLPFAVYGVSLMIFVTARFVLWEPPRKALIEEDLTSRAEPGGERRLMSAAFIIICFATLFSSILFYLIPLEMAVFLRARAPISSGSVGVLIAISSLGNPIGAMIYRYYSHRTPAELLCFCYLVSGTGLILMAISGNFAQITASAFVNQLGCGLLSPVLMGAAMNVLPARSRGRGGGFYATSFFLGQFLCPLALIFLATFAGTMDNAFMGLGLVSFTAAVVSLAIIQKGRKPAPAL